MTITVLSSVRALDGEDFAHAFVVLKSSYDLHRRSLPGARRGHEMLDSLDENDSEMEKYWVLGTGPQASPGAVSSFL
jgi:hypothetical protein